MAAHSNRTDLVADTSRQPGELPADAQGQKAAKQRVMAAGPDLPTPGSRGPLLRPTERPSEPVSAGLPVGPGPGPTAGRISTLDRVRAAYAQYPSEALRSMLEIMERAESRGRR